MIKTLLIITALLSIYSIIASTENLSIVYAERDDEEDELSKRDVAVLCDASKTMKHIKNNAINCMIRYKMLR